MGPITGEEEPAEMLALVFGMEEGMRAFYEELARRTEDEALVNLFGKLSEIEVGHKQMLKDLYERRFPDAAGALDAKVDGSRMEVGVGTDEILEAYGADLRSTEDVLTLAMALETQALDLYLRYAQRSTDPDTKAVLHELADEEKQHLAFLGKELDKKAG